MSTKFIDTQSILECLQRSVEKALERKRRLGQYAVVWEDGQIKNIEFNLPLGEVESKKESKPVV
ncbi:MAG TPA: hypothetical protein EYQ50_23695 [Verrucomicrobiales bacterium]|nr:hypothetical protein [Verrucomicrobiales bacterium]HIL68780.1 hypothetical protein [Verrucomicrobiota bacterium]